MHKDPTDNFYPFGLRGRSAIIHPMDKAHQHLEVELFVMENSFTRKLGDQISFFDETQCSFFWGCIPHQLLEVTPPGEGFIAYIPLSLFCRLDLPPLFVQAILTGKDLALNRTPIVNEAIESLKRCLPPPEHPSQKVTKSEELWIHAALHTLAEEYLKQQGITNSSASSAENTAALSHVTRMIYYIVLNSDKTLSANIISQHVNLNPTYARNIFKKTVGVTPHTFILNYRLERAKHLLTGTNLNILDIALDCGFNSVSQFYAQFNKNVNTTPSLYRENN